MNITIDDINLAYDDVGTGPVLMLIHGFPLNRQMWQPQLTPIAEAGFRVIAPDLRGFGASDAPAGGYSMDLFADDIVGLLDALDIEKAVVGGMSMGGYVLLNLMERYPDRVRAACFIATRANADDEAGRARRSAMAAEAERLGANPVIKIFAELLFATETAERNPELIALVTSWMRNAAPKGLAGGLLAMRDRKDYVEDLKSFQLPSLVLAGAEDRAAPLEVAKVLIDGLPGCKSRIIDKAGHMLNMEQPEIFNKTLIDFLNSVPE
ncbi:alpha/beta hydrolase [Geomonas nitrogeniifigens]|uniref:Alpha/beta hydrolase n=1 Tax=Geomonas diazotrophica TaxID=2843197 RepID=A0ABX8JKS8_9BACT|nr:alpha/beta fold hydrolase [Geomonas nitrogeniifigens]QWV97771.1 alpha/beta hydrolase [Geomonas nitrogeniifigens]QXE86911.1 alpha/beta hydrolase [Geomonas nitrogeniifigens]